MRLTRAQTQDLNRARVLAAAMAEFTERGYRATRIDAVAARADLTRGAVYSNFPGKRALYFAVLAERAVVGDPEPGGTPRAALGSLARSWLARLPLATDEQDGAARLGVDLIPEVLADEATRRPYAQLLKLHATVLGLALEHLAASPGSPRRLVRLAEAALTTLHGAAQLAAAAPGFVEPFDVVRACERLADLDLGDLWPPPPLTTPVDAVDEPWSPPAGLVDALTGAPAHVGDGVLAVLGLHRLSAAEEAVRAAPPGTTVTVAVVSHDPAELGPLARLAVADLRRDLHHALPARTHPPLHLVHDEHATLATAAGVPTVTSDTETAVHIDADRITHRATGFGACHAAARAAHHPARRGPV